MLHTPRELRYRELCESVAHHCACEYYVHVDYELMSHLWNHMTAFACTTVLLGSDATDWK